MEQNFVLNFSLCKSVSGKTDVNGNYIFEVEASNENIDLQNQIVLQNALMKSKDNFLKKGVISWDHLHKQQDEKGNIVSHPEMVIGEPVDVWTDGKSTFVKGILYKSNKIARDLIQKLKDGSTRIRASVGGIFPKIKKDNNDIECVTSVLWNDLALTVSPVNNSVGAACFAKSLNANEFVDIYKSLSVGYGTDSSTFTGGRALTRQSINQKTLDIPQTKIYNEAKEKLLNAMESKDVQTFDDMVNFLKGFDIPENQSLAIADDLIYGGTKAMKRSFGTACENILKSLQKGKQVDKDEFKEDFDEEDLFKKSDEEALENDEVDDEVDYDEDSEDENEDEDKDDTEEVEKSKSCKKSMNGDFVDATELIKSLAEKLDTMTEQLDDLKKSLSDTTEKNEKLEAMVKTLQDEPIPMQSVVSKSLNANKVTQPKDARPTQEDFEQVQKILCKSFKEGKIDLMKSTRYEREVQQCMRGKGSISEECFNFISNEMKSSN